MLGFIHLQKTAGITVTWILRSSFGPRHLDLPPPKYLADPVLTARELKYWSRFYGTVKSFRGHSVVPYVDFDESFPEIQFFTFFREPVKRMASWFQFQVQQKKSGRLPDVTPENMLEKFQEWIQEESRHNWQTQRIAGEVDIDAAIRVIRDKDIFVGLVESFDESMLLLKGLVSSDLDIAYRRRNVATADTMAKTLVESEWARAQLVEANQADLQLYDYVTTELYPGYRRAYGSSLQDDLGVYRASSKDFNQTNVTLWKLKHLVSVMPRIYLRRQKVEK